jgi:ankyrin repeat protein
LSAFLSYHLVDIIPLWGLPTFLFFLGPLINKTNKILVDSQIDRNSQIVNVQTTQIHGHNYVDASTTTDLPVNRNASPCEPAVTSSVTTRVTSANILVPIDTVGLGNRTAVGQPTRVGTSVNDDDLIHAALEGDEDAVKILLDDGAEVDQHGAYGLTPLSWAVRKGHEAVVDLLIDAAADVNAITYGNVTLLILAAQNGHNAVAELLLKAGASVNDVGGGGYSPLILAVRACHGVAIGFLLRKGAKVDQRDTDGFTALSWAIQQGQEAVAEVLLNAGASVNGERGDDHTPLMLAAQEGHYGVVKILLANGAEVDRSDADDFTALSWARWGGHEAVVKLLDEASSVNDDGSRTKPESEVAAVQLDTAVRS